MGSIKAALDALDKATPGPWKIRRDDCHFDSMTEIYCDYGVVAESNREEDAPILAAAPDMAAWIKDAVLWLEELKKEQNRYGFVFTQSGKKYAELDALLAQVGG